MAGPTGFYNGVTQTPISAAKAVAVTKSDTVNFEYVARGIYVGGTGDVVIVILGTGVVVERKFDAAVVWIDWTDGEED